MRKMLWKIKHNSIKANNKGIVNKYLYCLWASGVDGISEMHTLSCLVLWTEQESELDSCSQDSEGFSIMSCKTRCSQDILEVRFVPLPPRLVPLLVRSIPLLHLHKTIRETLLKLSSQSASLPPAAPEEASPLQGYFPLLPIHIKFEVQADGPLCDPSTFNQLYQLCLSSLLSTPTHLKVQPQYFIAAMLASLRQICSVFFFWEAFSPFFAWKVPTHSTILRANVTSLLKLSPLP